MDMYAALADHTRRDILELLAKKGELSASAIYDEFDVSHPAISQHLKVLRESNLVSVEKKAQQRIYQLNTTQIKELEGWASQMTRVWERRFDALDKVLQKQQVKKGGEKRG